MGQEERNPPGYFYATNAINWWFFAASFALLILVFWMVWLDWKGFRDWKDYQERFQQIEAERLEKERDEAAARIDPSQRAELDVREKAARKELKQRREDLAAAQEAYQAVEAKRYKIDQFYKFARAEIDSVRYDYEEVRRGHAKGDEAALKAKLDAAEKRAADLRVQLEAVEAEHREADARRQALVAGVAVVEKAQQALFAEVDKIDRALARVADTPLNRAFNAPPLDVVAPTIKIKQIVLSDLGDDYHFTNVPKVDRCTTCHLAIDRKGFEDQPHPFRTHPRLDLYLSDSSHHPMKEFGCTVCHGGRPRAVEFTRANHTPSTEAQAAEWKEKYHWHADLAGHEWERPMLPGTMLQASCYKCHKSIDAVPGADVLNTGRAAFQRFGCYGCHKTEGFEDPAPVAPDLSRLASKTSRDWTHAWISDPKAFRPDTTMPRFFGLSNSGTEADRKRDHAAVASVVDYLFHFSAPHEHVHVPVGDAERGKRAFQTLGCLGCHAAGDVKPATPSKLYVPDLARIADKTTPEWVFHWIKDPTAHYPETRMPNLRLSDAEAADITAYLMTFKESAPQGVAAPPVPDVRAAALEFLAGRFTTEDLSTRYEGIVMESLARTVARVSLEQSEGLLAFALGEARLAQVESMKEQMFVELASSYDARLAEGDRRRYMAHRIRAGQELARLGDTDLRARLAAIVADEKRGLYRHFEGAPLARGLLDQVANRPFERILEEAQAAWSGAGLWTSTVEGVIAHAVRRFREEMIRLEAAGPAAQERLFLGERTLNHYGCAGCHAIPGVPRGFGIGVELTGSQAIGSKDIHRFDFGFVPIEHRRWNFFVQKLHDPRIYDLVFPARHGVAHGEGDVAPTRERPTGVREKKFLDKLRMPNFQMSDQEARSIAAFLTGLVKDPIPERYLHRLGPAETVVEAGEKLLARFNCAGCHVLDEAHLVLDYDEKDPATGRSVTRRVTVAGSLISFMDEDEEQMVEEFKPNAGVKLGEFELSSSRATSELKGLAGNPRFVDLTAPRGGGLGQNLAALYKEGDDAFDVVNQGPPVLEGEGRKVRVEWLQDFLRSPYEIRPNVWPRMPTFPFTAQERNILSQYFAYKEGMGHPLPPVPAHPAGTAEYLAAHADRIEKVRRFFWGQTDPNANFCVKCHIVGDGKVHTPPPENAKTLLEKKAWAPDVERMDARLRPDWILAWVRDPAKIRPGTNMPTFDWKEMETKYGFNEEDVLAFLLNFHKLGEKPALPAPAPK